MTKPSKDELNGKIIPALAEAGLSKEDIDRIVKHILDED